MKNIEYYKNHFADYCNCLIKNKYSNKPPHKQRDSFLTDFNLFFQEQISRKSIDKWLNPNNHEAPKLETLLNICEFFDCDLDYFFGEQTEENKDNSYISNNLGLSLESIKQLKSNKDYLLVVNSLLENKGIDYLVQAIQEHIYYQHMHNYIAGKLKVDKLPGVTQTDLNSFNSNLKFGNERQKDSYAAVCFDEILEDQTLLDYFRSQALDRFSHQLDTDTKDIFQINTLKN